MKKILVPATVLFILWLLLSGHYSGLLVTLGALSCLGVAMLAASLGTLDPDHRTFAFLVRLAAYVPWLLKEIVMANWTVAKIIWRPDLPIRPRVIRPHASQRSPIGLAVFANSITLTPGTLSMDADTSGEIAVHALDDESAQGLMTGEMDRRVAALESRD